MSALAKLAENPYDPDKMSWEDFSFEVDNGLTMMELTGRGELERNAAAAIGLLIKQSAGMSLDQVRATSIEPNMVAANRTLYIKLIACWPPAQLVRPSCW